MHISNVSAQNFKGSTFKHELFPLTLIGGKNWVGKSTITDAIRLALLGKLREVPATKELPGEKATFQLSSGVYMNVGVTLSPEGIRMERTWSTKGSSVAMQVDGTLPQAVEDSLGFMLNIEEFFGLSEDKRNAYLFSAIPLGSEFSQDALIAKIKNIRVATNNVASEKAIQKVIAELENIDNSGGNIQSYYEQALELVKTLKSSADAYHKRMTAGAQMIASLQAMEEQAKAYDPVQLAARRSALNDQENQLSTDYGKLKQARDQHDRSATMIQNARDYIEAHKDFDKTTPDTLAKARPTLAAELVRLIEEHRKAAKIMSGAASAAGTAKAILRERAGDMDGANDAVENFDKHTCCPTCGAKTKGWKTAVLKTLQDTADAAKVAYDKAKVAVEEAEAVHKKADTAYETVNTAMEQAKKKLEEHDELARTANSIFQKFSSAEATLKAFPDQQPTDSGYTVQLTELQEKIGDLRAERGKIEMDIAKSQAIQADIKRIAQSQQERMTAEAEVAVCKQVLDILIEDREQLVKTAVDKIIGRVNYFTKGILRSELVFENAQFCYRHEKGHLVTYRTFSGGEKLFAYMAISLALSTLSPFKLAIIDELGRLHPEVLPLLLDRVQKALEDGLLDQFIGAIPATKIDSMKEKGFTTLLVK